MRHYRTIFRKLSKRNVFAKLVIVIEFTKLGDLDNLA